MSNRFIPDFRGSYAAVPIRFPVEVASGDGAITSVAGGIVMITKDTAAALTLAAPAADGARLTLLSTTAAAHTCTVAGGIAGAGSSADVLTFGAAAGNGVSLIGYGGNWYIDPGTSLNVTPG